VRERPKSDEIDAALRGFHLSNMPISIDQLIGGSAAYAHRRFAPRTPKESARTVNVGVCAWLRIKILRRCNALRCVLFSHFEHFPASGYGTVVLAAAGTGDQRQRQRPAQRQSWET
jgi:hypothetical protein